MEEVNRENKKKKSEISRIKLRFYFFLAFSLSSFAVDWYFEHVANCRDFIIIIPRIIFKHTRRASWEEKWRKINSHIFYTYIYTVIDLIQDNHIG